MEPVRVYGSGDHGTADLLGELRRKNVPHIFFDIRRHNLVDGLRNRENLLFILKSGFQTVPQVFGHSGRHIGGFDEVRSWIGKIKTPLTVNYRG